MTPDPLTASSLAYAASALALVIGLLLLCHQVAKRWGGLSRAPRKGGTADLPMRLVQVLPIDARRRVSLIECGTQYLAVLTGGPNDAVLAQWTANAKEPVP